MGNCWSQGPPTINRGSSSTREVPLQVQCPEIKDQKGITKLPPKLQDVGDLRIVSAVNPLVEFTYNELKSITENFKEYVLGVGGFGFVYRGFMTDHVTEGLQPLQVAVKVHDAVNSFQGHKEWMAEVELLGDLSHPNLVKLIGFCCEDEHRVLIYELMARGSVESHLFSSHLTATSDVYSYGVVLLELLTGKKSLDKSRPAGQQELVNWIVPYLTQKKRVLSIIDPRLGKDYPEKAVQRVARLAYHCISHNPRARPLMRDVVDSLEPLQ